MLKSLCVVITLTLFPAALSAACPFSIEFLIDGNDGFNTGFNVAMADGVMVATAPSGQGKAFIFEKNIEGEWEQAALFHDPGGEGAEFGWSADTDGQRVIISKPLGRVVVYEKDAQDGTWNSVANLVLPIEQAEGDDLTYAWGSVVAIDGDVIAINDPSHFPQAIEIFERQEDGTWLNSDSLIEPDGLSVFSMPALDVRGDRIAWTASLFLGEPEIPDQVYVFERDPVRGWSHTTTIVDAQGGKFGQSLALGDDELWIGCPFDSQGLETDEPIGSVQIYEPHEDGQWALIDTLTPPLTFTGFSGNQFGAAVAFDEHFAVVGAPFRHNRRGVAYIYERNDGGAWEQVAFMRSFLPNFLNRFGRSVSIDGDEIVIGGQGVLGGVSVFPTSALPCFGDFNEDNVINGADVAMLLANWGPPEYIEPSCGDTNDDNIVNGVDLATVLSRWGQACN